MKRLSPYQSLLLLLLLGTGFGLEAMAVSSTVSVDTVTVVTAMIPAPSLAGGLFGGQEEQPCVILLPSSYEESDREYPTIYFLPGGGESATTHRYTFSSDLIVRNVIIVLVNGLHSLLGNSYYTNSPVLGNWEDYVVHDVVNYVDANYRTINNSDFRGLAGFSMGGAGALMIAMKHPDIFGVVYAMAPAIFDEAGFWNMWFHSSTTIASTLAVYDSLSGLNATEAHNQYVSFLESLTIFDTRIVTLSFGSAFSPNSAMGAPYFNYLYQRNSSGGVELNETIAEAWENSWGRLEQKIEIYKQNLLDLRGIAVEYGLADSNWLKNGCEQFSQIACGQNINHTLIKTDLVHSVTFNRIRNYMMPFFWQLFTFQTATVFMPSPLNLKSYTETLSAFVLSPNRTDLGAIVPNSVKLNDSIAILDEEPPSYEDYDGDGIPDLLVRFDRHEISDWILSTGSQYGEVTLTLTGWLAYGASFEASSSVGFRIPGDANMDGYVGIDDLLFVAQAFGACQDNSRYSSVADENEDGYVGIDDLFLVAFEFGKAY